MLTFGSLFAGIGGFDLGFERAGMVCKWQVEIDPFCQKVLAKHWPNVERFGDVRDCGKHNLSAVDVICGGFPCQDISHAGKRAGIIEGTRSGLWLEYVRIIRELRPRFIVVENVSALLVWELGTVLGDLAACGYDAEWQVLPAAALGAPHIRERCFILAYPDGVGFQVCKNLLTRRSLSGFEFGDLGKVWQSPSPDIFRVGDGVPAELDRGRIKAMGNAVVPQVAEWIGRRIVAVSE